MTKLILILTIFVNFNLFGQIKDTARIRKFLSTTNLENFHKILILQVLDKMDLSQVNDEAKEKFIKYVMTNYTLTQMNAYLISEINLNFSEEELSDLEKLHQDIFFKKMNDMVFGIYNDFEKDEKVLNEYLTSKENKLVQRRFEIALEIIKNSSLEQNNNSILKMMGKLFYFNYNDTQKKSGLTKLEASIVLRNMEEKTKDEYFDKLAKLLYFKTRYNVLSELNQFSIMAKNKAYKKFLKSSLTVMSSYYEHLVDEKGIE